MQLGVNKGVFNHIWVSTLSLFLAYTLHIVCGLYILTPTLNHHLVIIHTEQTSFYSLPHSPSPLNFCCVKCICLCGATILSENVFGSSCVILHSMELGVIMPSLQFPRQSLNWMWQQESEGSHGSGQINFLGKNTVMHAELTTFSLQVLMPPC